MNVVEVLKFVTTTEIENVPDDDLITVSAAAKLAGYSYSGIVRLMERGVLPFYQLLVPADDKRVFTSKAAVAALPPKPHKAKATKKRKRGK